MNWLWTLVIAGMLLFTPITAIADEWTKEDTARQITFTLVTCVDWLQTKEIARNPKYREGNPFLGPNPSQKKVDTYIAGAIVGHALISYLLPTKAEVFSYKINPRAIWQYFWIGVEAGASFHNYNAGVRIRW